MFFIKNKLLFGPFAALFFFDNITPIDLDSDKHKNESIRVLYECRRWELLTRAANGTATEDERTLLLKNLITMLSNTAQECRNCDLFCISKLDDFFKDKIDFDSLVSSTRQTLSETEKIFNIECSKISGIKKIYPYSDLCDSIEGHRRCVELKNSYWPQYFGWLVRKNYKQNSIFDHYGRLFLDYLNKLSIDGLADSPEVFLKTALKLRVLTEPEIVFLEADQEHVENTFVWVEKSRYWFFDKFQEKSRLNSGVRLKKVANCLKSLVELLKQFFVKQSVQSNVSEKLIDSFIFLDGIAIGGDNFLIDVENESVCPIASMLAENLTDSDIEKIIKMQQNPDLVKPGIAKLLIDQSEALRKFFTWICCEQFDELTFSPASSSGAAGLKNQDLALQASIEFRNQIYQDFGLMIASVGELEARSQGCRFDCRWNYEQQVLILVKKILDQSIVQCEKFIEGFLEKTKSEVWQYLGTHGSVDQLRNTIRTLVFGYMDRIRRILEQYNQYALAGYFKKEFSILSSYYKYMLEAYGNTGLFLAKTFKDRFAHEMDLEMRRDDVLDAYKAYLTLDDDYKNDLNLGVAPEKLERDKKALAQGSKKLMLAVISFRAMVNPERVFCEKTIDQKNNFLIDAKVLYESYKIRKKESSFQELS